MIKIYIASPYTSDPENNTRKAMLVMHDLMDRGFAPFCPHLTHFPHLLKQRPYQDWLALDNEWLKYCDAILRLPGESNGADLEVILAKQISIPIFTSIEDLMKFFGK